MSAGTINNKFKFKIIDSRDNSSFLLSEEGGVDPLCTQFFPKRNIRTYHPIEVFLILVACPSSINVDEKFFIIRLFALLELFGNKDNKGRNIYIFGFSKKVVFSKDYFLFPSPFALTEASRKFHVMMYTAVLKLSKF